jgi:hypothetical protein
MRWLLLWPDEIFQSLEPAHRLVWGYGIVPWEFRVGARSWLLPGFLAAICAATAGLGEGSTGYLTGVRCVLSLMSLAIPASAYVLARRRYGATTALLAACLVAAWFELVYFAPKAFAEVIATHLFVPGLVWLDSEPTARKRLISSGFLLGLASALRPHLAPAVLASVCYSWHSQRRARALLWPLLWSFAIPVIASGVLDALTWGMPFQSIWQNLRVNFAGHRALINSRAPWFGYLWIVTRVWWPWSFGIVALIVIGARQQRALAYALLTTLVLHSLVPHKEYRYIYPVLALSTVLLSLGLCEIAQRIQRLRPSATWLGPACSSALLIIGLYASLTLGQRYEFGATSLAGGSGEPPFLWTHFRGMLLAFEALSTDANVCGVGLANRHWDRSAGYSYLHRDVPIFQISDNAAYKRYASGFNIFIANADSGPAIGRYERSRCWDQTCIYRRPGACAKLPGYDINRELIAADD